MIKAKKALVFDTSSIITLALNNLLSILGPLKKSFKGNFFLTDTVKKETIDKPLKMRRFTLEALMIKKLTNSRILEVIKTKELQKKTREVLRIANSTFYTDNETIRLIHKGEASCLALYNLLETENKALVIDERTTRMLCEAPENLRKLFEKKLHKNVKAIEENYDFFKHLKIIRSSELCFIAYKKRIINLPTSPEESIAALLYAAKFKGCSISTREIEAAKRL